MNFKRLICILLIISLMFTLTGCVAEGAKIIVLLGQRLISVAGNFAIAGIAYVAEWATQPLFEMTGKCACSFSAALFRGWNRIIDPNEEIIPWSTIDAERLSFHDDHILYLQEKGKLPLTGEVEGGMDRFLGDETPEWKDGDKAPFPEGEEPKTNLLGRIFRCKHELKYKEKKNILKCWCGANEFTAEDVPDWNYETFAACIPKLQSLHDKKGVESFLKFKGVNKALFSMMENLEDATPDEISWEKMNALTEMMENVKLADTVYVNYMATPDELKAAEKFDEKFDNALTVVSGMVHLNRMIEEKADMNTACDEFIETLKANASMASPDAANTYLLVGLDSLKPVIDAYLFGADQKINENNVMSLTLDKLEGDGQFQNKWQHMIWPTTTWDKDLTFDHIVGTQKNPQVLLPSLPEIVNAYPALSDLGKVVADRYIIYCMNRAFKMTMGISYEDYVNFISKY